MGKESVEKRCRVCNQSKPLSEFIKDKAYKDGYRTECKNVKSISEFCKDRYYKDGYHHICKSCQSKRQKEMKTRWEKERKQQSKKIESKTCIKCNKILPISQFTRSVNIKDGFDSICKTCQTQRKKEYKKRWKKQRLQKPDSIKEKECPSCHRILPLSEFYESDSHKDGLSFYCKRCSLQKQKYCSDKWEQERSKKRTMIKEKECNICHRVLPISQFYKNRRFKSGINATCIRCEHRRQIEYIANWKEKRSQKEEIIDEKECIGCHRILPISSFNQNKRRKDGLTSSCKECEAKRLGRYMVKWKNERATKSDDDSILFPSFEKRCCVCNRVLPLSNFYTRPGSKDGFNASCKECDLKRAKTYRLKKKDRPKITSKEKLCKRCKRTLPSSMFHKNCDSNDGLSTYCGECKNKMHKEYRNNPETHEKLLKY